MARKTGKTKAAPEGAKKSFGVRRFAITYVLLMGAFFLLIGLKPVQNVIDLNGLYTNAVVVATAKVLTVMGIACSHSGSLIHLPYITLDVKFGCNGLEAVMIYSVAVIAFPATWKRKIAGIAAGFLIIQVINIFRIAALAYSGIHFKELFEYIHVYVAQGMMIAVSLAVFFVYLHYLHGKRSSVA